MCVCVGGDWGGATEISSSCEHFGGLTEYFAFPKYFACVTLTHLGFQ